MSEPSPVPVPQELVDAAKPYTAKPPVYLITGPTTEEIEYDLGTVPVGSWLGWDEKSEPTFNGPVMIFNHDPSGDFDPVGQGGSE